MSVPPLNGPRLIQLTDTHLFADSATVHAGVRPAPRLRAVIDALGDWVDAAGALVHTGDLVHDGSMAAYQRLHATLSGLGRPVRVVPGNHDDRGTLRTVFAADPVSAARTLVLGDWTIIGLDSLQPGAVTGRLSDAELAGLDAALAGLTTRWALIALHHPPMAVGTPWLDAIGLEAPEPLLARIEAAPRVRALISGHVHSAFDGRWRGCRVLSTPATAAQFLAGADTFTTDPARPVFRWLDLRADGGLDTGLVHVPLD